VRNPFFQSPQFGIFVDCRMCLRRNVKGNICMGSTGRIRDPAVLAFGQLGDFAK
jgi:hypothetical protein